jgi:DNA-binding transcriptional LysR family regulator
MALYTNLDMDVLRTLAIGVDLGSFARAADRLGRSPSAVSAQIHKLEQQVGEPLFSKSGRKLVLTHAGESMLSYARRMLELNDEAITAVRGMQVEGWVRLGLPQDFAESWLPGVLRHFTRAHPKVKVEVRVERSAEMIERVMRGQLDLALTWGAAAPDVSAERLGDWPVEWIGAAADHGISHLTDEPLPLFVFESPCVFRAAGIKALDSAGIPWRLAFTSPSLAGLWAAVEGGLGITVRTPFALPASLRVLAPATTGLPALPNMALSLHHADAEHSLAAARLAALLKEALVRSRTSSLSAA